MSSHHNKSPHNRCTCGCFELAYDKVFADLPQHEVHDRLSAFLYLLMRDHVPSGTVAELVVLVSNTKPEDSFFLSNGHLAKCAEYLADKLVPQAEEAGE